MQAIILAAGLGRRLRDLTSENTKCMVEVNGEPIIDRLLRQLATQDLQRIIIVIGYEGEKLRNHIEELAPDLPITFIENPIYDKTNNIYSLWLTRHLLAEDDTMLFESDLVVEDAVIEAAFHSKDPDVALVAHYQTWMDGTMVTLDEQGYIINFIPKRAFDYADSNEYYKTANIYRFSKEFLNNRYIPFLNAYIHALGENEYYEQVLRVITMIDRQELKGLDITGLKWYEIDDIQDLRIAETIFAEPEERLKKLQHAYGGYWRYPDILDFCYLVNPYFPDQRMIEEMQANFDPLLREYPSGMGVNSLLAGKYFGVGQDYIVVGNGAAELIKEVMESSTGAVGVVRPTFEEYPNRLEADNVISFVPDTDGFRYSAADIKTFLDKQPQIKTMLIVNPDNPSGNLLSFKDIVELSNFTIQRGIRLLVDESFIDFANKSFTLLDDDFLSGHPNVMVMKSISKSYGVPGLRLGVLACGDKEFIAHLKKRVSIWNINSFAEFYMQIFGKYESKYEEACRQIRCERDRMYEALKSIKGLDVFPSAANYFLCRLHGSITSHQLTLSLLTNYDILIKDCTGKPGFPPGRYIRLAVRDRKDNDRLIEAIRKELSNQ